MKTCENCADHAVAQNGCCCLQGYDKRHQQIEDGEREDCPVFQQKYVD
jgi:hypothetical protein